jgi:hypothetical protein
MKTGNGKIANLPSNIRDELNYRLSDGEEGAELVAWLNAKPEVVKVIHERFDGLPISEQNLSEWRKRGYQKWLAHRNMFDESNALGDNALVIAETGVDCDKLLLTLTAAYAEAIQNWIVTPCEQMTYKLAVYKNLTNGVIALRRAEIQKVRLEIERERLELLREKRHKSASSTASPASSSSESPTTSQAIPKEDSKRGQAIPSPTPSTASPRSTPPSNQAPPAGAASPAPKSAEPPAQPMPPSSMPVTQPPSRPTPAYRDPRSRYSLA